MRRGRGIDGTASGQATIEAAGCLLSFLLVLLSVFDVARIGVAWVGLQHGVREAARIGVVGRTRGGHDRPATIVETVRVESGQPVAPSDVVLEHLRNGVRGSGPGGSMDVLLIRASVPVPLYAPWLHAVFGPTHVVRAHASGRNEDFDSVTYPTLASTSTTRATVTSTTAAPTTTTLASTTTTVASTTTTRATTTSTARSTSTRAPTTTRPTTTTSTRAPVTTTARPTSTTRARSTSTTSLRPATTTSTTRPTTTRASTTTTSSVPPTTTTLPYG